MFCKNCGKEIEDGKELCADCEAKVAAGTQKVEEPVKEVVAEVKKEESNTEAKVETKSEPKSKMAAGLLGIFLGAYGVHNFYLGYMTKAIIQVSVSGAGLLLSFCTFGISAFASVGMGIWGLIEGIMILCGSIKVDGKGNPLKE